MAREPTYLQSLHVEHSNGELLRFALALGVPQAMRELARRGGPIEADWEVAQAFGDTLAERADNLLYRSKKRGETARLCAELIRHMAVMAYVPGGVSLLGLHFDAGTPDSNGVVCCNTLEGSVV